MFASLRSSPDYRIISSQAWYFCVSRRISIVITVCRRCMVQDLVHIILTAVVTLVLHVEYI